MRILGKPPFPETTVTTFGMPKVRFKASICAWFISDKILSGVLLCCGDGLPLGAYCIPIWRRSPIPHIHPRVFLQFPELRRVAGTDQGQICSFQEFKFERPESKELAAGQNLGRRTECVGCACFSTMRVANSEK